MTRRANLLILLALLAFLALPRRWADVWLGAAPKRREMAAYLLLLWMAPDARM